MGLNMKYYFAPMEGVTGYLYRNVHRAFFDSIDKYFIPFIVPTQNQKFSAREQKDILPEHNRNMTAIPQILTNRAEDFIRTAGKLKEMGYGEINLNLGCPSKTVVSKHRGAGFLALQEELDQFLEQIFEKADVKISVKTRIGKTSPDEFYRLIEIYNKYPMEELIVHPRLQSDFYKNKPNMTVFKDAVRLSKNPLCYNGDLFSKADYDRFREEFPEAECVMLGRGLIANPGLVDELKHNVPLSKDKLMKFHTAILQAYQENIFGDRNLLFKMKELWVYMASVFQDSEKYAKKIKKAQKLADYEDAVSALFQERELNVTVHS